MNEKFKKKEYTKRIARKQYNVVRSSYIGICCIHFPSRHTQEDVQRHRAQLQKRTLQRTTTAVWLALRTSEYAFGYILECDTIVAIGIPLSIVVVGTTTVTIVVAA